MIVEIFTDERLGAGMTRTTMLTGRRKASAKLGDDVSLSRFIRVPGAAKAAKPRQLSLDTRHPALMAAKSLFHAKQVRRPDEMRSLLVSGHSNMKVGRDVRKGRLRGYWIYTLSLEERATCPRSCHHWSTCYGNNMPWAKRVDHTTDDFLPRLEREIADLLAVRGRIGILVRLHALGDFYSVDYVRFWRMLLMRHKRLAVFGYTAREPDSDIGWTVRGLASDFRERAMIRFSNAAWPLMATVPITRPEQCPPNAFVCPEQTGRTRACATCALCWGTRRNVAFLDH